ncbi:hypothetical protein AWN76_013820 [Rhodothermaceae bacterium RA]|nr:hypothetical protein AWN76_013820 [Rhodothermaceae bacterium RA]
MIGMRFLFAPARRATLARGALLLLLAGLLAGPGAAPAQAQKNPDDNLQKLAQTGMKFLSVSVDPRMAALGDAVTALEGEVTSLFYNPAGMATQTRALSVTAAQVGWIADISYNNVGLAFRPFGGRLGVFGLTLTAVDYGEIKATVRADNEQGFERLPNIKPTALALGIGYARSLTDRFAVGGHVKWVQQDLGRSAMQRTATGFTLQDNAVSVLAFDFGIRYRTGFRSLTFAIAARNFSEEVVYEEESFQLPLALRIGMAMNLVDLTSADPSVHAFVLSVDAETPRDYAEQIKIGGEYTFMQAVSLRAGYVFPTDQQGVNLGLGVQQDLGGLFFGVDYAYTDFGVFNESASLYGVSGVHRVAVRLSL